jgi:uncharacterized protein
LTVLWALAGTGAGAWAEDAAGRGGLPLLVDGADVLSGDEEASIAARLGEVSDEWDADVVVVSVESLGSRTATQFAEEFFFYGPSREDPSAPASGGEAGYGRGAGRSGLFLVASMADRDWAIATHGEAIDVFTDARQDRIMSQVRPWMTGGDWGRAFREFADQAGEAYRDDARFPLAMVLLVALAAGLVGAFGPVTVWRRQLKSVQPAVAAREYLDRGSVVLAGSSDRMVSQHTSVIDTSSSSAGGRGGSSTHIGAGGSRFGGSSGKF